MCIKILFSLILISVFSISCFKNSDKNLQEVSNQKTQEVTDNKTEKIEKPKFLFNAVNLLGKKSSEIDKFFGKPTDIIGESKSDPSIKSRWRWYKYPKDNSVKELSVFIDKDTENDIATSITILFNKKLTKAEEIAPTLGIDLTNQLPLKSETRIDLNYQEQRYEIN